ncbi:MAG: phage holin family protein [Nocardioidaceae bacterium]|nr:MAG: phage holin family protein [Nocardioidaceae bacterium]
MRLQLHVSDLLRLVLSWAAASLALMLTSAFLDGLTANTGWQYVWVAGIAGVLGFFLRPVLVEVSARIGWIAVILVTLLGQAIIMYLAIHIVPGITSTRGTTLAAAWISAFAGTVISYLLTAGTDDGLVTSLMHRGKRVAGIDDPDIDGVIFVQLDGVPYPVMQWAVQSGAVPTIRRWLTSDTHVLREWIPQLPCTTPASQLGILHGTVDRVPAFRWYDRELGRVLVANRPADARIIEQRASTGDGLLAGGGVSVSNLFTGDADRALMTMSAVELGRGSTQTRRAFAWFLLTPSGFARSLTRSAAELFRERWQARRQVRRNLVPRMHRNWSFAGLRAVTNGLLCDLNTAIVAEELRQGTKAIYVNYVDYDEIAHHAGMFRPESLTALDGLDKTLGALEKLAAAAPRRYHLVALSDHGQSQGESFEDRHGEDLGDLCGRLMELEVTTLDASVEGWGRAEAIAADIGPGGITGAIAHRTDKRVQEEYAEYDDTEGPVVLGSGNLGLLYLPEAQRLTLEELDRRWPRLIPGLAEHPGIGFIAVINQVGTPWAIGANGRHNLDTGEITGTDPLTKFGERAPRLLRRAVLMAEAPDVYINSAVDEITDDVAAFEHLVGAHGGLGGWQDSAVLLAPSEFSQLLPDDIEGADVLHEVLVAMLQTSGHRRGS